MVVFGAYYPWIWGHYCISKCSGDSETEKREMPVAAEPVTTDCTF
jgi:hypothetical protein